MEPQQPAPSTGPAAVVEQVCALLGELTETMWAAKTPEEPVAANEQIEMARSQLAAVQASVVAEVGARGIAKNELAWSSTGDWFTHTAGTHRRTGHRAARQAPMLVGERVATHQALGRGDVSPEQAATIVDAIEALPPNEELRREAERVLLGEATRLDATELTAVGKKIAAVVDPERAERKLEAQLEQEERAAHRNRFLSISPDGAGGVWLKGRGTAEDAAVIKAALLPLTKPAPAADPRQPTLDPDSKEPDQGRPVEVRDHGTRMWDALVQVAQHAMDTDLPPDAHGARPRLAVTTNVESLREQMDWTTLGHAGCGGTSGGLTADGAHLSPATVRRLACDADIIPVTLGTTGQPLDVGRANRLVTPALWTALVCRDRHCAFPGCTRPPVMCHAHHIIHWANGGTTALVNLVMLCGQHHRVIHDTPWEVRLNPADGRPEFQPHPDAASHKPGPDPAPGENEHKPVDPSHPVTADHRPQPFDVRGGNLRPSERVPLLHIRIEEVQ